MNRQPATSCRLQIRWTYIVCFEYVLARGKKLPGAYSLNLYCPFWIWTSCLLPINWTDLFQIGTWIGNQQLVAGCRFVELLLSVSNLNRHPATGYRFVELILSVSNLNRQPATSCQLPIRWTCLYRFGNWIGNRQPVASYRFDELILFISNLNRQVVASCRYAELVCIESATESATNCRLPIRWACLYWIGNWSGNRQLVASYRFVELILSVSNLNWQPATSCQLPIRWTHIVRFESDSETGN